MAKRANTNSRNYHTSRTKIARPTEAIEVIRARRAIVTVILLSMLVVILAVLLTIFSTPERVVKGKVESISADYYENYFYPQVAASSVAPSESLSRYKDTGLSSISLSQLLQFDNGRHASVADIIKKYCDDNYSYIHIYPTEPYGQKNYRIEYFYTCNF